MTYKLSFYAAGDNRSSISSTAILKMLNPEIPSHVTHIDAINRIEKHGTKYSNEDFDILAAAWRAAA